MKHLFTTAIAGIMALSMGAAVPVAPHTHGAAKFTHTLNAKRALTPRHSRPAAASRDGSVLLNETFAKMTAGSPSAPVAIETDDYYNIPSSLLTSEYGWGGFLLSQAGGQLFVAGGTEEDYGILWTPNLPDGGTYTISFDVRIPSDEDVMDYVVVTFYETDEYMTDENYEGDYDFDIIDNEWHTVSFEFESLSADPESEVWMEFYSNDYSDMLIRNVVITREADDEGEGGGDIDIPDTGDAIVITMGDGANYFGDAVGTWKTQGFTLKADSNGGNNNPVVNGNTHDLRIYAGGTFTVSADVNITSIQFALSQKGEQRIAEIDASTGKIVKQGANPLVWVGKAKSVTFTVGGSSIGTEYGKAGQLDFTTLTITTEEGEDPDEPVDPEDVSVVYKGLVDNADDWMIETYWPDDDSYTPWAWTDKYGLKATGYYDGAAQETEGLAGVWVDLTEYTNCTLTFEHALNYLDLSKYDREWFVDIYAYDEYAQSDDDIMTLDVNWPSGTNWAFVSSGEVDLSYFDGMGTIIVLYYYSGPVDGDEGGANVAATWEVKNFVITGEKASGVREVIYDSNADAPAEYYDLNGRRVANPTTGIYIMRRGDKVSKIIVK